MKRGASQERNTNVVSCQRSHANRAEGVSRYIILIFILFLSSCGCHHYKYSVELQYNNWLDRSYNSDSIINAGGNYILFYTEESYLVQHIGPYKITYNDK